jgi:hypothetical protein
MVRLLATATEDRDRRLRILVLAQGPTMSKVAVG